MAYIFYHRTLTSNHTPISVGHMYSKLASQRKYDKFDRIGLNYFSLIRIYKKTTKKHINFNMGLPNFEN